MMPRRTASNDSYGGLFGTIYYGAVVGDVTVNVSISGSASEVGALAGINEGTIEDCFASGSVKGGFAVGGLVGNNGGAIFSSGASASANGQRIVGGLVGWNSDSVIDSFATGSVSMGSGIGAAPRPIVGGLVGYNRGGIGASFATGSVTGGSYSEAGGLVGYSHGYVGDSYSTGSVYGSKAGSFAGFGAHGANFATSYGTGHLDKGKGGFIGVAKPSDKIEYAYWDTDTTGITNLSQGAGNIPNFPGITGLTTSQLQSGLPAGFDSSVWAESPDINGGLPYLIANPPHRSIR